MSKWTGMSEWAAMSKKGRGEGVLFHHTGASGLNRRRDHADYLKGRSEHDFRDQHDRFTEEEA